VGGREAVEGEQVLLGLDEQVGHPGRCTGEALDHRSGTLAGHRQVRGIEDLAESRRDHAPLGRSAVTEHFAHEVDGAALPGAGQDPGDRRLQARVLVGHAQPDAREAALPERAQEGDPEGLRLRLADVEPDDLAPAALVDAIGDHPCR
jgi:hypothetical protein